MLWEDEGEYPLELLTREATSRHARNSFGGVTGAEVSKEWVRNE